MRLLIYIYPSVFVRIIHDPALLTAEMMSDCYIALECWEAVELDYAGYGGKVLARLFKKHQNTQMHFPNLVGIPEYDLEGNGKVSAHGAAVLKELGRLLRGAKNATALIELLGRHPCAVKILKLFIAVLVEVMTEKGHPRYKLRAFERVMVDIIANIDD
ncbi:myoglobin-like isoform X1 [Labeo rohita]|uniref:myoglobin-like isoform X1 n=1 Tax=Labeo rohita TaxID=84645 RepID=UPI0021E2BA93|nr:myoglobin-like isoform X1 [Labeo rohita]